MKDSHKNKQLEPLDCWHPWWSFQRAMESLSDGSHSTRKFRFCSLSLKSVPCSHPTFLLVAVKHLPPPSFWLNGASRKLLCLSVDSLHNTAREIKANLRGIMRGALLFQSPGTDFILILFKIMKSSRHFGWISVLEFGVLVSQKGTPSKQLLSADLLQGPCYFDVATAGWCSQKFLWAFGTVI